MSLKTGSRVAGGFVLAMIFASSATAQIALPARDGISAGHLVLYPSLTVDYLHESNVLFGSGIGSGNEIIAAGVRVIQPRIVAELPIGANRIRWSYSPAYRDYTTSQVAQTQRVSHFFDLEGKFKMGSSLDIALRDHFVRGTTELREVDPGGETAFGLAPFTLHEPELDVDLALGARQGISIIPRYTSTRFDDLQSASFFDYRSRRLEGRYNYRVGPLDTLYGYYALDDTQQHRDDPTFGEITQTARTAGLGLRRVINEAVTSSLSVGYQTLTFNGVADQDFSGVILDASATWHLGDTTRIEFAGRRNPYPSFFENNNYYLNNEIATRIAEQIGQNTYVTVAGTYQVNHYTQTSTTFGVRRRDRVVHLEAGIGRQFLRSLRAFVGYNRDRRDSNVDLATYTVDRIIFRIELGWL